MNNQVLAALLAAAATAKKPYKRQVAYLESTGTQYIELDHGFDVTDEVEAEYMFNSAPGNDKYPVAPKVWNDNLDRFALPGQYNDHVVAMLGSGGSLVGALSPETTIASVLGVFYQATYRSKRFTFGELEKDFSNIAFGSATANLRLFYGYNSPTSVAIKYYKQTSQNFSYDFIPVLDWNNRPAMYDKVSKQLFYNQGTGEFLYPMEDDDSFTIDLSITADNLQFGVQPYWNIGGYCNMDWGDGNTRAATTSGVALTHTYAEAGSYRVKVRGDMFRFRVGSTNPAAVIDCNGNWEALGEITNGQDMFRYCANALFTFRSLPRGLTLSRFMFQGCSNALLPITALPPTLIYASNMFQMCQKALLPFTALPSSLTECSGMFLDCTSKETSIFNLPESVTTTASMFQASHIPVDIDLLAGNSPVGGWSELTNIGTMFRYCSVYTSGHIATFMRKCPSVNNVAGAFDNTNATTFGDNDYFEVTLTTTEANQSWGFTATSSAGRWYCFDWGDGTAVTANKNLDVFTSGEKVSHTFATPGTYHIKLATAPCTIVFDPYDSDNGNYAALGQ